MAVPPYQRPGAGLMPGTDDPLLRRPEKFQEPMPDTAALTARPTVNLRHFPRLAAGQQDNPAVHELVMAPFDDETIAVAWTGTSELEFPRFPAKNSTTWPRCAPGRVSGMSWLTRLPTFVPCKSAAAALVRPLPEGEP